MQYLGMYFVLQQKQIEEVQILKAFLSFLSFPLNF